MPRISVVIPAYNEASYLPATLASVRDAAAYLGEPVEIIVADNCSTDGTVAIAEATGAKVVTVVRKSIAAVRNGGAAAATGEYLAFCDADNLMSPNLLQEICQALDSGRYIGGGVRNVKMQRLSLGTFLFNWFPLNISPWFTGVSMVLFSPDVPRSRLSAVSTKKTLMAEDYEFGRRLKRFGRCNRKSYKHLQRAYVVVSTRKYDEFGDYFILTQAPKVIRAILGDRAVLDEFWYKPNR